MKLSHRKILALTAASLLFVKCDCSSTAASLVISAGDEYKIGQQFHKTLALGDSTQAAQTFLQLPGRKELPGTKLDTSAAARQVAKYVDSLGRALAASIDDDDWATLLPYAQDSVTKSNYFEFRVIKDPTVNAFAVAGGKVYFYTGILKEMKSEAELMGVLGHEIGHVVRHHTRSRIIKRSAVQIALSLALGDAGAFGQLAGALGANWWLNNNGQGDELESDSMGVTLSYRAGSNPSGVRSFFSNGLEFDANGNCIQSSNWFGKTLESFSTHPPHCDRVTLAKSLESKLPSDANARPIKETVYQQNVKIMPGVTAFQNNFVAPLGRIN